MLDLDSNICLGRVTCRQDKQQELVIEGRAPNAGQYSLVIYGKPWSESISFKQHIATYLVSSSTGVDEEFPLARTGEEPANLRYVQNLSETETVKLILREFAALVWFRFRIKRQCCFLMTPPVTSFSSLKRRLNV